MPQTTSRKRATASAKPTLPKATGRRVSAPRALLCVSGTTAEGEKCFWVNNGPILADINDLFRALDDMTDAQFAHHVMKGKNDFSLWVRDVLGHAACAKRLINAKTRASARKAIAECCTTC